VLLFLGAALRDELFDEALEALLPPLDAELLEAEDPLLEADEPPLRVALRPAVDPVLDFLVAEDLPAAPFLAAPPLTDAFVAVRLAELLLFLAAPFDDAPFLLAALPAPFVTIPPFLAADDLPAVLFLAAPFLETAFDEAFEEALLLPFFTADFLAAPLEEVPFLAADFFVAVFADEPLFFTAVFLAAPFLAAVLDDDLEALLALLFLAVAFFAAPLEAPPFLAAPLEALPFFAVAFFVAFAMFNGF
jgi:hypothetical protein